jgi:rubrerythrin
VRGGNENWAGFQSLKSWWSDCPHLGDGDSIAKSLFLRKKRDVMKTILALLCGLGMIASFGVAASDAISTSTMNNLQAAFNGESNAHARYLAFAEKADTEGYAGVASLFRAAARAEEIHAGNHAAVIRKFAGLPVAELEYPAVASTRENLAAAIKGETYERDEMYPAFIRQAKSEANAEALRTLTFARAAEVKHAKLYTEALQDLESMKASQVFYVCPVCGFTTPEPVSERCPTFATPKERFEQVS